LKSPSRNALPLNYECYRLIRMKSSVLLSVAGGMPWRCNPSGRCPMARPPLHKTLTTARR